MKWLSLGLSGMGMLGLIRGFAEGDTFIMAIGFAATAMNMIAAAMISAEEKFG